MSKLLQLRPYEAVRAVKRMGCYLARQTGSHAVYCHPDGRWTVIPMYKGTLAKGTLKSILKDLKVTQEEFKKYL